MVIYLEKFDGAVECWGLKYDLRYEFENSRHWSDEKWKSTNGRSGGNKKSFPYCTDPSRQEILYLRALQGHSGRILIDPSLQDNVLIPTNFFEYINHFGCAINVHSVMNSGLVLEGQNLSKRETVFFKSVDLLNEEHKDPNDIDLEAPRLAWDKQKIGEDIKTRCTGVDIQFAQRK